MEAIDQELYRSALGQFATGVTVVTTRNTEGEPVGVTANSFNSVSLDPPMVLWSLAKSAHSMPAFSNADMFAVHILGSDQQDISVRFASRGADKFAGLNLSSEGVPTLDDCAARFICRTAYQYEGGDHVIFVGEVVDFTAHDKLPLLYVSGRYAETRRSAAGETDGIDPEKAHIGPQSLTHLLAYAYRQITRQMNRDLEACDMQQPRLAIMIAVGQHNCPEWAEVRRRVESSGFSLADADLDQMIDLGWIAAENGRLGITTEGRKYYYEALSRLHALEQRFCEGLTDSELAEARYVLNNVIDKISDGAPSLIR